MKINLTPEILHEKTKKTKPDQFQYPYNPDVGRFSMVSLTEYNDGISYLYNGHIISHYDLYLKNNVRVCRLFKLKDGYGAANITQDQFVAEIELP